MTGAEFAAKVAKTLRVAISNTVGGVLAGEFDAVITALTADNSKARDVLLRKLEDAAADVAGARADLAAMTADRDEALQLVKDHESGVEVECAVWRREADAAAHAGLRAQERAEKAEAERDAALRSDAAWRQQCADTEKCWDDEKARADQTEADAAAMRDALMVAWPWSNDPDEGIIDTGAACHACGMITYDSDDKNTIPHLPTCPTNSDAGRALLTEIARLREENVISDKIMVEQTRLLALFECPEHGRCVPHAIDEVQRLRAENAALKEQIEAVDHECKRQLETDRYKAALGRAHAALRAIIEPAKALQIARGDQWAPATHDAFVEAEKLALAVLADPDGEATVEYVAALEAKAALLDAPEIHDFAKAVVLEAAHQRSRWSVDHDAGKTDADWFWLIGYLAGKALATTAEEGDKQLHRIITIAAAACNWHAAKLGKTTMRPGIDGDAALGHAHAAVEALRAVKP